MTTYPTSFINVKVKNAAEDIGMIRTFHLSRPSSRVEEDWDWKHANAVISSGILKGTIRFEKIPKESYQILENQWLKYIKCHIAHMNSQRNGGSAPEENYMKACKDIRRLLVKKTSMEKFCPVEDYLKEKYLDGDGKIDLSKDSAIELIKRKANRIWGTETIPLTQTQNWLNAETYVEMFYESIIPAVKKKDLEKTLTVLKAFQFSKAPSHRFLIINCFEAALAIYFLDADIISKLWKKSAQSPLPECQIESIVKVHSWPNSFRIPGEFAHNTGYTFEFTGDSIAFKGLMTQVQKKALLDAYTKAAGKGKNTKHIEAIEKLYDQSRLIHEKTTL